MSARRVFPGSLAVLSEEFPSIWLREYPGETDVREELRVYGGVLLVLEVVTDRRWEDDPSIRVLAPGSVSGWTFLSRLDILCEETSPRQSKTAHCSARVGSC